MELPCEIWCKIFGYVKDIGEVYQLCLTCKFFNNSVKQEIITLVGFAPRFQVSHLLKFHKLQYLCCFVHTSALSLKNDLKCLTFKQLKCVYVRNYDVLQTQDIDRVRTFINNNPQLMNFYIVSRRFSGTPGESTGRDIISLDCQGKLYMEHEFLFKIQNPNIKSIRVHSLDHDLAHLINDYWYRYPLHINFTELRRHRFHENIYRPCTVLLSNDEAPQCYPADESVVCHVAHKFIMNASIDIRSFIKRMTDLITYFPRGDYSQVVYNWAERKRIVLERLGNFVSAQYQDLDPLKYEEAYRESAKLLEEYQLYKVKLEFIVIAGITFKVI